MPPHPPRAPRWCFRKETGALLPLIFIVVLYRDPARSKYAAYYLAPFAALAIWFFALWRTTGHIFGDPGFTQYNTIYSLNPVRAAVALLRRFYYLFIADFRWVGSLAIIVAWKRSGILLHARLENRLVFYRRPYPAGQPARRRYAGTLSAASAAVGLYRDGRGLPPCASTLAHHRRRGPRPRDCSRDSS